MVCVRPAPAGVAPHVPARLPARVPRPDDVARRRQARRARAHRHRARVPQVRH